MLLSPFPALMLRNPELKPLVFRSSMPDPSLAKLSVTYPYNRTIDAVQHVQRMRGGAQSHLLLCSDGEYYVIKFQNNPQHIRVLANEMLAALLALPLGLPLPEVVAIRVNRLLVEANPEMTICLAHTTIACHAGIECGSRYVVRPTEGQVYDYIPSDALDGRVRNLGMFSRVLLLDKWLGNSDGRQAAFWRRDQQRKYAAAFIDQGNCFNAGDWTFPDYPLHGVYAHNEAYAAVTGWDSFEPQLSLIEATTLTSILGAAGAIPAEWYGNDWGSLATLALELSNRVGKVRELVTNFRLSVRRPFPNWK
jgi:hypothetical protein